MSEIGDLKKTILTHSDRVADILGGRRGCTTFPRTRVPHPEGGESKTKQSLSEGTDINRILDRWLQHGTAVAHLNPQVASYGDFSSGLDYAEALNAVKAAEADFAALPARVRAKCGNSPAEFLQIIFDPSREEDREGLGLGFARSGKGDTPASSGGGKSPAVDDQVVVDGSSRDVPQGEI